MIKKILALVLIIAIAVLIVGCGSDTTEEKTQDTVQEQAPARTDSEVQDIESDLGDLDTLEDDLGLDELENLDKELDELNW